MKPILSIIALLVCSVAQGQSFTSQQELMKKKLETAKEEASQKITEYWNNVNLQLYDYSRVGVATIQTFDTRYAGVQGSPYLFNEWMKGAVMLTGINQPQLALLNYDCVNDQLIFRDKDGQQSSLPNDMVNSFAVQDSVKTDSLHYFIVIKSANSKSSFYEVLYSDRTILLERNKKVLRKADYQRAYSPDRRSDEYIELNELFIYNEKEGKLHKIKLNKKSVAGLYPQYAAKLESFLEKNDIKLKNKGELVQVLHYMDAL